VLGARFRASLRACFEFVAAELPVPIEIKACELLRPALLALGGAGATLPFALAAARFGARTELVLGQRPVAVRVEANEAGVDLGRDFGAGDRLRRGTGGGGLLGGGGSRSQSGNRSADKDEILHDIAP
jgi:hypothetical protein